MSKVFGTYFKQQRLSKTPLSLNKFAKAIGISPAYLSKIETGKERPTFQIIQKMAKLLDMDENLLAGRAGVINPKISQIVIKNNNDLFKTSIPQILEYLSSNNNSNRYTAQEIIARVDELSKIYQNNNSKQTKKLITDRLNFNSNPNLIIIVVSTIETAAKYLLSKDTSSKKWQEELSEKFKLNEQEKQLLEASVKARNYFIHQCGCLREGMTEILLRFLYTLHNKLMDSI